MNTLKILRTKLYFLNNYECLTYLIAQRKFAINPIPKIFETTHQRYLPKYNYSLIPHKYFCDKPDKKSKASTQKNKDDSPSQDYKPETDLELQQFLEALHKDFKFEKDGDAIKEVSIQNENENNNNSQDSKDVNLSPSLREKFKAYDEEDFEVILSHEEQEYFYAQKYNSDIQPEFTVYKEKPSIDKFSKKRGVEGVFDIEDFVEVLKSEKVADIAVIFVPPERAFCQHLVIGTGASPRHMKATMELINKLYKARKNSKDPFVKVNGENSQDWKVLDMGNIIFHLFLKKTRETYDLETLWTVGPEFDSLCNAKDEVDALTDLLEPHLKYLNEAMPLENESTISSQSPP